MNVNAVSTNNYGLSPFNTHQPPGATASKTGSGSTSPSGGFQALVLNALNSLSGSTASSSNGASVSGASREADPTSASLAPAQQQAMGAFMHSLFQALHAQNGGANVSASGAGTTTDPDGDTDGSTSATPDAGRDGGHPRMNMASDLQSLMRQLSTASSADTGAPSGASSTGGVSTLQSSFQTLATALGVSGSKASLSTFLSNLSAQLPVHNQQQVVNTYA